MPFVDISTDFGSNWRTVRTDPSLILVIAPGAGLYANRNAYDHLRSSGFQLVTVDCNTRRSWI